MISHRYEAGGAHERSGVPAVPDRVSKLRDNPPSHKKSLPFLLLLYVLNGNHDPHKVQGLNLALALLSFGVSFFMGWDLLPVGLVFLGAAVVNELNLWCIKRFFGYPLPAGTGDLLAEIQRWSAK